MHGQVTKEIHASSYARPVHSRPYKDQGRIVQVGNGGFPSIIRHAVLQEVLDFQD
jgi:hypothetical protein